ncbi:MAG: HEPN domain-containing protein [Firmicutes bacterium]|nr:HEPN domain-containing protein [Alicyclobacillaceae bacterium]MCL6498337.1 HEPN domain-containing protein [Bacillota bacterium]
MNADVEAWAAYAREDLAVAIAALAAGWLNSACFHAQQCGEKWLKALLVHHSQPPPRAHDLDYLLDLLEGFMTISPSVREASLVLTQYAVVSRYPDGEPIDQEEAVLAVEHAKQIQAWAEGQIPGIG